MKITERRDEEDSTTAVASRLQLWMKQPQVWIRLQCTGRRQARRAQLPGSLHRSVAAVAEVGAIFFWREDTVLGEVVGYYAAGVYLSRSGAMRAVVEGGATTVLLPR